MARSRNSFQSGYQYTLENFDRDAMKNDQIWRETQSRIEFLKMRNITMSNSADRNSLARKLVADKEWKQLDKFTKLMEMIMYLQSWFDKRLVFWKKIVWYDENKLNNIQFSTVGLAIDYIIHA